MYYYVKGELTYSDQSVAVVECAGVGYKLTISLITADVLSHKRGEIVRLFTHLSVREDGIELFGFLSEEERNVFNLLTGVSGVGPKAAMSLLSSFSPDKLIFAVGTEDVKSLARANGIGGKTAARIVLELKDKVSGDLFRQSGATAAKPDGTLLEATKKNGKLSEATEALTALGYDKSQILSALRGVDIEKMTLEEIITAALRKFVK